MKSWSAIVGLLSLAKVASAQQTAYGQCGGQGWTGPTSCITGSYCQQQNDYYSQCVPGSGSSTPSTAEPSSPATSIALGSGSSTLTTNSGSGDSSDAESSSSYSKTDGTRFNIDGTTKYYAGTNCYWIGFLTNNDDVDTALNHIQSSGLKILRVWGFNDVNTVPGTGNVYFQYLSASGSTINTGEYGLQRLDYVVQAAESRGVKLIINFVNNWSDYGGINAYVQAFGGNATTWYTNSAAQTQYKAYVKAVVSRYLTSTAVFAWELANEPRCHGCDTSVIYNWATEISEYIKQLDSNHMVTLGDEGFGLPGDGSYPYTYDEGVDWVKNLGIKTLDFGTLHLYPSSWGTNDTWGNPWITSHAAQCVTAGKPCFLEEYGMTSDHCSNEAPWQSTSLSTAGMGGDAFWDFGDTLSNGQTANDGNTIFYNTSDWTCLVTNHIAAINSAST